MVGTQEEQNILNAYKKVKKKIRPKIVHEEVSYSTGSVLKKLGIPNRFSNKQIIKSRPRATVIIDKPVSFAEEKRMFFKS